MTELKVIQSWSREVLESAFTQREQQLGNALKERDELKQQAKRLEAECGVMRDFILAFNYDESGHLDAWPSYNSWKNAITSTTAGRDLLMKLERYEKALISISSGPAAHNYKIAREALKGKTP